MSKQIYTPEITAELRATMGRRIKATRKAKNLTQAQVARGIGISAEFYAPVERGTALPSVETLRKVADFLEVSVDHLFGWGEATSPMSPATYNDSRQIQYLAKHAQNDIELARSMQRLVTLCMKRNI